MKLQIEIRECLQSTPDYPLWRAIVTTKGRCYASPFAGEKPSEEKVKQAWQEDRNAFDPYLG